MKCNIQLNNIPERNKTSLTQILPKNMKDAETHIEDSITEVPKTENADQYPPQT